MQLNNLQEKRPIAEDRDLVLHIYLNCHAT